jgi:Holliday junction resolvasome RuvABC endonuclease subunit
VICKNNETNTREIGFIAQDVEVLLNKLGYTHSGMLTTADDGRLSLRYNDFIPVLTKAMQELHDKTTALEKINTELLARIKKLESKK